MAKRGRPRVERITVECFACGKEVQRYPSQVEQNKTGRFFCSKECQYEIGVKPRRKSYKECQTCGVVFYPNSGNKGLYCSVDCHNVAQTKSKEIECEVCGQAFEVKPSQLKAGRRFCSRDCYSQSLWKRPLDRKHNGKPALLNNDGYVVVWEPDDGWVREHRLVMEEEVGRPLESNEHVHHINGDKTDNRLENLMILGHSEHSSITSQERLSQIEEDRAKLKRYQELYGPLPEDD